jgi:DNA invertase Pin-like site-specific DNA recombinase
MDSDKNKVRTHKKWTQEEDNIIIENYIINGVKYCKEKLPHRRIDLITLRARKLGILKTEKRVCKSWTDYEEDMIGLPRKYAKYIEIKNAILESKNEYIKKIKEYSLKIYNKGLTFTQTINKTGISKTTFRRLLNNEKNSINNKLNIFNSKKELALKMFKEGVNKKKISKEVGISLKALNRHIKLNS